MNHRIVICGLALLAGTVLGAGGAMALEVDEVSPPRVVVEGEFFSTLDVVSQTDADGEPLLSDTRLNTGDSNIEFILDKPLYQSGLVGGVALNLALEHEAVQPRLSAFLGTSAYRLSFGQMRLRNTGVRFATLRDGDLRTYTHIPNASLETEEEAAQLYGDVVVIDLYYRPAFLRLSLFGAERVQTTAGGDGAFVEDDDALANSGGAALAYEVPDGMRYEYSLRKLMVLHDVQTVERLDAERGSVAATLLAGVVGLNDNPEYPWEVAVQLLRNQGLDEGPATTETQLNRETYTSAVLGLSFGNRKFLQTRWRAGLTLAQKTFADLDDASQWSAVPAWFHRIGNGLDLVAQANYTSYSDGLANVTGRQTDLTVQIGITMALDAAFNDNVVDPASILETEQDRIFRGF